MKAEDLYRAWNMQDKLNSLIRVRKQHHINLSILILSSFAVFVNSTASFLGLITLPVSMIVGMLAGGVWGFYAWIVIQSYKELKELLEKK